ncbi:hypothetical protein [Pseudomonas brassicacearum]|uniref:Stability determinant domain-containing protein n=1 Tax=Pseudomonas brassicacearum TaxID=930166 RepID=A0A423GY47_9PSED|nr:hypothetical protein BK658_05765 [Pseudomonas brassicacearum]
MANPSKPIETQNTIDNAAYDAWFREQVQASIDDPRPSIEDDEAKRFMAKKRDVLRRRTDR